MKNKFIYIFLFVVIIANANTIKEAKFLFDEKENYKEAVKILENYSENPESQYYIGKAYLFGLGVKINEKKAFQLASKSASMNNSYGINLLGVLYQNGNGVEKDLVKAVELYEKSASMNNTKAIMNLTRLYANGTGVEKDYLKACDYAKKAADLNDPDGLIGLGTCYRLGVGKYKKDLLESLIYFKMAAKFKSKRAANFIAKIYEEGSDLIKKDLNESLKWYKKVIEFGDNSAYEGIANLYFNLKDYDNALINYLKYEDFNSPSDSIFIRIAMIYKNKKNNNKNKEYLKKARTKLIDEATLLNDEDSILNLIYSQDKVNLPEKEYLKWMKKGVELKLELAYLPLYQFYSKKRDIKKLLNFLKNSYIKDKNIEMGCLLSSFYMNFIGASSFSKSFSNTYEYIDYEKVYEITNDIVKNNPNDKKAYMCYGNLARLYEEGFYVAKDLQKAIDIRKMSANISVEFAAKRDREYIIEKEKQLKKENLNLKEKLVNSNKIFPFLDNFSKKEQVFSYLETNDYYMISVSDKSIKIYDKKNLTLIKELRAWIDNGVSGLFLKMAFDEKKQLLYASTLDNPNDMSKNDIIKVFDINTGKVVNTLLNKKSIKNINLEISDDGKYLLAINNKYFVNLIDTKTNDIVHFNYKNIANFIKAKIEKVDDDYLIYLLSTENELITLSVNERKRIEKVAFNNQMSFSKIFKNNYRIKDTEKIFKFKSNEIESLNLTNNSIEFDYKNEYMELNFRNLKLKNIDAFQKEDEKEKESLIKLVKKNNGQVIQIVDTKKNKSKEYFIGKDIKVIKTLSIENKYLLLVTTDISQMLIANLQGDIILKLEGFNVIQSNIFYLNNRLVSFGEDNILNIFNLRELDKITYNPNDYNMEVINSFSKLFRQTPNKVIDKFKSLANSNSNLGLILQKEQQLNFKPTNNQISNFYKLFALKKQIIKPVSMYIKNNKDWIIYTPEGLFTYGGNGKNLIKYHQNQGLYKEAKIIENEKLFDKFYRPDLIKKILAGEKVEIPMDIKSVILNINPPELNILEKKFVNKKDLDLTYQICDAGSGVSNEKILINGRSIEPPVTRGFKIERKKENEKCKIYKSTITLSPGKNNISLKAYDKDKNIYNKSEPIEITANYKTIEKPNLHFLSIAIADYENDELDLNYPINDVESVKKELKAKSSSIYKNIYTYDLHDSNVTKENISNIFDKISKKLENNDAFILYISGHGIVKDGIYHLLTYKSNETLSINDIKQNLSKIITDKSLVLLDTCQSGSVIESINTETMVKRLEHDDNRNYIVASSKNQVALEGYKEHGVFTYSVLDAFRKNNKLKVWGLAEHVSELVPKITYEKFNFEQKPEAKLNKNFQIGGN